MTKTVADLIEYLQTLPHDAEVSIIQLARQQVPGWKLVPVEPTLEMANASVYNGTDYTGSFDFDDFKKDWSDILAAAPAPVAEPASQWVAVSERLPNVTQEVIVFSSFEGVCAGVLDSYGEWFAPCSEYKLTRVTHWMSLPPAPEMVNPDGPK